MSSSTQQPVQNLPTLPTQPFRLELHSIISSRSLRNFRNVAGREQQEKTVTRLTHKRGTLSSLRARTRHPKLFLTPQIGCLTKRRGHNFFIRIVARRRPISRDEIGNVQFFLCRSASSKHRSSETRCAKHAKSAVRHATRRVKNMRGLYL